MNYAHSVDLHLNRVGFLKAERSPAVLLALTCPVWTCICVLAPCFLLLSFSPCAAIVPGLLVSPQPLWVEGKA